MILTAGPSRPLAPWAGLPALLVFCLATAVPAAEIHISDGDSFESAAESLAAGDTLVVHAGTYSHSGRLAITAKGTAQQPVVITGATGEAKPLIVLTASGQNVVNITGASYLTLRDLEITANGIGGADGVNMSGSPSYITLENLTIHDIAVGINFRSSMHHIVARHNHIYNTTGTGEGMYVGCHDASCAVSDSLIENNWIHDTKNASQGDGIEIKRGSHSNIVRDNVIHDTKYPCIILYGTEGNPRNVVERNVAWNCADAAIQVAADTIVRNNVFIPGSGRGIASQSHAGVSPKDLEFVHNTIIGGSPCVYTSGWSNKPGMVFANNAVYCASGNYSFNGLTGATVVGNVFEPMPGNVAAASNTEGRSETQDFLDHAARNVYPASDSAVLAAGDSTYAALDDFNGTARTAGVDAGAYAWTGAENPGWAIVPGFKDSSVDGPTLSLSATPDNVVYQGQSTLNWSALNVVACDASGAWSGSKPESGQHDTGPLTEDSDFTLTCVNSAGDSIGRSVTVTVAQMPANGPTLSLTAEAPSVPMNGSAVLSWVSTAANTCTASGDWSGSKPMSGSESTGPLSSSSTFVLECAGSGGDVNRSVTIAVQPVVADEPNSESSGGGALSWLSLCALLFIRRRPARRAAGRPET